MIGSPKCSLYKYAQQYKVISFDIFDTLIARNLEQPEDVFFLTGYSYYQNNYDKAEQFYKLRKEAELAARKKAEDKEITLDGIYNELPYAKKETEALKKVEISIEQIVCTAKRKNIDAYNKLLSEGKKVYLISDMYLSREVITSLLDKCGIKGYSGLYLSCEQGCRKRNGLFELFKKAERIKRKDWLHVGDSLYSDVLNAKRSGASVYWVKASRKNTSRNRGEESLLYSCSLNRFICCHLDESKSYFYQIGYKVFGPLLYGFTKWAGSKIAEQNISKILFFARDAYIIYKAFEVLYGEGDNMIYFYLSRQSDFSTRLQGNYSSKNVLNVVHKRTNQTLLGLLKRIHADTEENIQLAKVKGIDLLRSFSATERFDNELSDYFEDVCKRMKDQYVHEDILFIKYVQQYVMEDDRIAVIDVGWNGTEQKAVELALQRCGIDVPVYGYYFGINQLRFGRESNLHMEGFLADEESSEKDRVRIKAIMGLLEFFLTAPHGTTSEYKEKNGRIVPVLSKYEYQNDDGTMMPETKVITELQAGALQFIKDFHQSGMEPFTMWNQLSSIEPMIRLCMRPTLNELISFGDLSFYEGIIAPIAKPHSITYYLKKPSQLKRDFGESVWKLGFIRRLFHNIPLPYVSLYRNLLKACKLI